MDTGGPWAVGPWAVGPWAVAVHIAMAVGPWAGVAVKKISASHCLVGTHFLVEEHVLWNMRKPETFEDPPLSRLMFPTGVYTLIAAWTSTSISFGTNQFVLGSSH